MSARNKGGRTHRAAKHHRQAAGNRVAPGSADPDPVYTWTCSWNTLQSNREGFFKAIFEGFEDSLSKSQLAAFANLDSDARRVAYLLGLEQIESLAPVPMFRQKNGKEAVDLMVQAERLLEKGNAGSALNLLSRAITKAPSKEGEKCELVSRLLALRSHALSDLGQLELALRDTQLALSAGVSDPFARAQLLRTQGQCYFALADQMRAKLAYISAQTLLDPKKSQFSQLRSELEAEIAKCVDTKPKNAKVKNTDTLVCPSLTGGESQIIPNASLLLGLHESPQTGRYVAAKSKVDAGDVLAVEPAFCSVLLMDKAGTHCHNCLTRLVAPVGCPDCSGVAFCGRECQKSACDTYHRVECKFLNLFIGLGMSVLSHLALRIITRTGSAKDFIKLWDAASRPCEGSEPKSVSDYRRLLRLVSHPDLRQTRDYLSRTLMAVFLLKCLQRSEHFWAPDLSAEDQVKVGEALLRHLCLLQFNAHEVFETLAWDRTKIKGTKTQYIGVAVYLSVALFNHDCNPSVERSFQGTTMILHALRPLHPGEMVGENYGPMFTKKTRAERQASLRARYWFNCACQACSENWNTFDQGIKSPDKTEALQKMFDMGFEAMEAGKLEGAVYLLSQFLNSIDGMVNLPDREVILAIDALRLCLMSLWGTVVVVQPPKTDNNNLQKEIESTVKITELLALEDGK
ncbi:SET and MYND domain-containing protein 4-like [Neocloeon triangulifer]|uniref:SET and MYND domain-containing protein 4-like n=1 Tax=Neocloeon triangulifer TaxID=2078957 RepID=UPI00286EB68F|nr:SET and MYND domain-containing protein 4-like [Neocloeon triangulifer]